MTPPAAVLERLARVPAPELPMTPAAAAALEDSVRYLDSDAAARSAEANVYWPKWNSPWWHMLLLFELGEARRIPERAVRGMLDGLNALPVKCFPIRLDDLPAGVDLAGDTTCHCALASAYQVLAACGVEVDRELPWAAPWFSTYQMADGGLNCDAAAYLVEGECPSSIVGTVAPLEAMLLKPGALLPPSSSAPADPIDPARATFVDRAARFLIERRLMLGSTTRHNARERDRETSWRQPCFPRFYFYDVLRGLHALARWAERRNASIPLPAIEPVLSHLLEAFPDGVVRLHRRSFEGVATAVRGATGTWTRQPASRFPLLDATSRIGEPSPALTRQWREVRQTLARLHEARQIDA